MIFYLGHIVWVGLSIKHLVDVGEVCVGLSIVIAEKYLISKSGPELKVQNLILTEGRQSGAHWLGDPRMHQGCG